MRANRLPKRFINKSFRMNIADESGEKAVHLLAPNMQWFARKERYQCHLERTFQIDTLEQCGPLPGRRKQAPRPHKRGAKSHFTPETSRLERGTTCKHFDRTVEL